MGALGVAKTAPPAPRYIIKTQHFCTTKGPPRDFHWGSYLEQVCDPKWTHLGPILGTFWDPKLGFNASSMAFDVAHARSAISNTPYSVLKDFCCHGGLKSKAKSNQNWYRNNFSFRFASRTDFSLILEGLQGEGARRGRS